MRNKKSVSSRLIPGLALAACLGAFLPGCGKNISPSTPAPKASPSSVPTYRFGYYFGPGTLNAPVAVGVSGDLIWVSNYGNTSLQTWSPELSLLGSITSYGSPVTAFLSPALLWVGPDGYIYVMDAQRSQVVVFSPTGNFETTFGKAQLGGDVGGGVVVNGNYAYISNSATPDVYGYTIGGSGPSKTFTASATFGTTGPGALQSSLGMALDSAGNLYVGDALADRVVVYNAQGAFQSAVTVTTNFDDGPANLALDSQGNIYCSMNQEPDVRMFSPSGALLAVIGYGDVTNPFGLAFDSAGNLYVVDSSPGANKVVVFLKN
jgi:tripartite motif-containing protein 71